MQATGYMTQGHFGDALPSRLPSTEKMKSEQPQKYTMNLG